MKLRTTLPAFMLAAFMLAACNTVEGVGRDVQAAGTAVEDVARETGDELSRED